MGQARLPGENPKAQAEEGYGPISTREPMGTAEGSSVLGRPKSSPQREGWKQYRTETWKEDLKYLGKAALTAI